MRVVFIVKEWRDSRLEVTRKDEVFENGAILSGSVYLDKSDEEKLKKAVDNGYYPILILNKE